jgi:hypothetical protein
VAVIDMASPISWPVLRLWLIFIGAGLLCFPLFWLLGGARTLYWSSIGLSLFASFGTIQVSFFIVNDLQRFCTALPGSRYIVAWLVGVLALYIVIGATIGYLVLLLGGGTLLYLAWLVVALCCASGVVTVLLGYMRARKRGSPQQPRPSRG